MIPAVLDVRARWQAWWAARTQPTERHLLTQRNVYIVPTRAGFAFALTVLLLLLASLNYQLNLGFALTFLLAGSAVASMHMTHGSLRGLTFHLRPPNPAFAGDAATIEVVVTNPGPMRHGIGFGLDHGSGSTPLAYAEIAAHSQTSVHLSWQVLQRGVKPLPMLRAESRFPFGLFRAWTLWRPAGRLWVYPKPERPLSPWPETAAGAGEERPDSSGASGEFDGVRSYRRGDTLRQVVWKKAARTGELVSRDNVTSVQRELWLQWNATRLAEPEARLARLCAWILAAEAAGHAWGLRLPGLELPPAQGAEHRHAALRALAQW